MTTITVLLVAGALAAGLGALAQEPDVGAALDLLATDRSAKVRAQAALAVRAAADRSDVRKALVAALEDPDAIVRAAAANALGAAPRTDVLEALVRVSRDRDPLVAKWSGWALRRTVGAAAKVRIGGLDVRVAAPGKPDALARTFQGALLGALLGSGNRFEVDGTDRSLDFSDEGEPMEAPAEGASDADRKALELMQQGRFDAAAMAALAEEEPEDPPVTVKLAAEVDTRDAAPGAVARVRLSLSLEGTGVIFEAGAEGVGRPRIVAAEERDEYTMEKRPEELRGEATDMAGVAVARALIARMSEVEVTPGGLPGARNGGRR